MKIYNSLTRKKEEFIPLESNKVKMYACGITVYDLSHIGHARQAIVYAMIAEYLRFRGYDVKYVRNYTDVDDKIINKANSLGKNALEFSKEQIKESAKSIWSKFMSTFSLMFSIISSSRYVSRSFTSLKYW